MKYRGRRLCLPCVEKIVPSADPLRGGDGEVRTEAEREEVTEFWGWYWESQKTRPARYSPPRKPGAPVRSTDELFPLCDCGGQREALKFGRQSGGLWGGPFLKECPVCRARREVEGHVRATSWLHPEWDDEEWLDLLYKIMPGAFALRVLPDYWYELKHNV